MSTIEVPEKNGLRRIRDGHMNTSNKLILCYNPINHDKYRNYQPLFRVIHKEYDCRDDQNSKK